jgi:hypothetical protein
LVARWRRRRHRFSSFSQVKLHCICQNDSNFLRNRASIDEGRSAGNFLGRGCISARAATPRARQRGCLSFIIRRSRTATFGDQPWGIRF